MKFGSYIFFTGDGKKILIFHLSKSNLNEIDQFAIHARNNLIDDVPFSTSFHSKFHLGEK